MTTRLLGGGEWAVNATDATSVADVGPNLFSLAIAYALPVDPTLPVWQQYVGYVIGIVTWWPILFLLGLSGAVAVAAEYR
ncbi:hypothetical protein OB955_18140 [Halobacteria archaeon AArc-m2/3/4]|uniref:Uncharacterized protein n=1 Tax=Natronoglomus mannanivorans TaxID=2979990 RepID=A0ABT2QI72_9EURY|nr:hypothetical protein [Halobacteria archaeon AArc-m2/3/4]